MKKEEEGELRSDEGMLKVVELLRCRRVESDEVDSR